MTHRSKRSSTPSIAIRSPSTTSTSATASPAPCSAPIPRTKTSHCPPRRNYSQLLHANPLRLMRAVFGPPTVFDVVVPLERNGAALRHCPCWRSHHAAARRLRALVDRRVTLDGFRAGHGLGRGFPAQQSRPAPLGRDQQAARLLTAHETAERGDRSARGKTRRSVSPTRSSASASACATSRRSSPHCKENLDQILGNLQDGILLFTGDGRAVLVSEAARRFLDWRQETASSACTRARSSTAPPFWAGPSAKPSMPAYPRAGRDPHRDRPPHSGLARLHPRRPHRARDWARWSRSTTWSRSKRSSPNSNFPAAWPPSAGSPPASAMRSRTPSTPSSSIWSCSRTSSADASAPAVRHLEVIDAEIHRLDRVVQMLVDFSRPVELQLREQDLRAVDRRCPHPGHDGVLHPQCDPGQPHASTAAHGQRRCRPAQAGRAQCHSKRRAGHARRRPAGCHAGSRRPQTAVLRIADQGPGIPDEIREKIFDLYFTTKSRRQRHRPGHDLPHSPAASWEHRSTIECRTRHGIPVANSAGCRGLGTASSSPSKQCCREGPDGCD